MGFGEDLARGFAGSFNSAFDMSMASYIDNQNYKKRLDDADRRRKQQEAEYWESPEGRHRMTQMGLDEKTQRITLRNVRQEAKRSSTEWDWKKQDREFTQKEMDDPNSDYNLERRVRRRTAEETLEEFDRADQEREDPNSLLNFQARLKRKIGERQLKELDAPLSYQTSSGTGRSAGSRGGSSPSRTAAPVSTSSGLDEKAKQFLETVRKDSSQAAEKEFERVMSNPPTYADVFGPQVPEGKKPEETLSGADLEMFAAESASVIEEAEFKKGVNWGRKYERLPRDYGVMGQGEFTFDEYNPESSPWFQKAVHEGASEDEALGFAQTIAANAAQGGRGFGSMYEDLSRAGPPDIQLGTGRPGPSPEVDQADRDVHGMPGGVQPNEPYKVNGPGDKLYDALASEIMAERQAFSPYGRLSQRDRRGMERFGFSPLANPQQEDANKASVPDPSEGMVGERIHDEYFPVYSELSRLAELEKAKKINPASRRSTSSQRSNAGVKMRRRLPLGMAPATTGWDSLSQR